jgi:hypothetical protein
MPSYVSGIAVSNLDRGVLYVWDVRSVWRSVDDGLTLTRMGGYSRPFVRLIPLSSSDLLIRETGPVSLGLRLSRDGGRSGKFLSVTEDISMAGTLWFDSAATLKVASQRLVDDQIVRGIYSLENSTWVWTGDDRNHSGIMQPFGSVFQDPNKTDVLLAEILTGANAFVRSFDRGNTWKSMNFFGVTQVFTGISPAATFLGDPVRPGVYYMATHEIRRSVDFGESWENISPVTSSSALGEKAGGLVLGPGSGELVTVFRDSVWESNDDGVSWRVIGRVDPGATVMSLTRHRTRPGKLIAATLNGAFISIDHGRNWDKVLHPEIGVWMAAKIREDPSDPETYYLATDRELYRSTNGGDTWGSLHQRFGGLPYVHDVAVDPVEPSSVYLATTSGVYRLTVSEVETAVMAIDSSPEAVSLQQNFPNPFNGTTVIRFKVARSDEVVLALYNVLGQRVRILVDDTLLPGEYQVTWDGRDNAGRLLASGVYLYRLRTGPEVLNRRLVFLE